MAMALTPTSRGNRNINKNIEFQIYPPNIFRTRFLWARLEKKMFQTWKSTKKTNLGPMLGQLRPEKTQDDL